MISRVLRVLALLGVCVVLAFYAEVLAHAPVAGQDFRNFYAAATVLHHGGNPYDIHQLLRQEARLYHPTTPAQRTSLAGNPYVQGPPVALALLPLVGDAPASVYRLYAVALAVMAIVALMLFSRLRPARHSWRRAAILAISPVTFAGLLLGQPDALLLLLLVGGLWWLARGQAALAGFAVALGLVKPQIMAGPLVILAVLAWRQRRLRPYVLGALAGALAFVAASVLLAGPAVALSWVRELVGFGGSTAYTQVDIASLTTLYLGWAPHALGTALALATLVAWGAGVALAWRYHGALDERWWLGVALTSWLLATPYAHPHDDVLLLPAVWLVLDRAPYRSASRVVAALLFAAWWLLPLTSVLGLRPPLMRGLGIIPVLLLLALLWLQQRRAAGSSVDYGDQAQTATTRVA